jgi:hypothetical protein
MVNQNGSEATQQASSKEEFIYTSSSAVLSLAMLAVLVEPDEIDRFNAGNMDVDQLTRLMMRRIPGGGEFGGTRIVRALGLRMTPEAIEHWFHDMNDEGYNLYNLFMGLDQRITALEEAQTPPEAEPQTNA